jgi:hypothetical protein
MTGSFAIESPPLASGKGTAFESIVSQYLKGIILWQSMRLTARCNASGRYRVAGQLSLSSIIVRVVRVGHRFI